MLLVLMWLVSVLVNYGRYIIWLSACHYLQTVAIFRSSLVTCFAADVVAREAGEENEP